MKVTQIHELLNTVTQEVLGTETVVKEDLSNLIDVGNEIIDSDKVDNFVQKLVHHIGKVEFNNKKYRGNVPNVLMDSWEYGSILQKIDGELPMATENETWNLENGKDYNPNIFYQPKVSSQFFDSKVCFEVPISFAEKQLKGSFSNVNQMNGFLSMLTNNVDTSMTVKLDSLIMRTINNYVGNVLSMENTNTSINLLKKYNEIHTDKLTVKDCLNNADFLKYATYVINTYTNRLTRISTLFNIGKRERFTNKEDCNLLLLTDFVNSCNVFLQSDVLHNELTKIEGFDTVPYWQGTGENYSFEDISKIDVVVNTGNGQNKEIKKSGIIGVVFDKNALGVSNLDRRVTTNYNPKAEFYTNFYKADAGYFNDFNQNFLVFYIEDAKTKKK